MSAYSRTPSAIEQDYYRQLVMMFARRRETLGLTQEDLDSRLGLSDGQVAKWEALQRVPGAFMLMCWSNALGLSLVAIHHQLEEASRQGESPRRREGETSWVQGVEAAGLPAERVQHPAPQLHLQLRQNVALRSVLPPLAPQVGGTVSSTPRASTSTGTGSPRPPRASDTGSSSGWSRPAGSSGSSSSPPSPSP